MTIDSEMLIRTIKALEAGKIHFVVQRNRMDAITLTIAVPGQRWEIDFVEDGTVEVEVFMSDGNVHDAGKIAELLRDFSDPPEP